MEQSFSFGCEEERLFRALRFSPLERNGVIAQPPAGARVLRLPRTRSRGAGPWSLCPGRGDARPSRLESRKSPGGSSPTRGCFSTSLATEEPRWFNWGDCSASSDTSSDASGPVPKAPEQEAGRTGSVMLCRGCQHALQRSIEGNI